MSNSYYNQMWHLAQQECSELDIEEQNLEVLTTTLTPSTSVVVPYDSNAKMALQSKIYELYLRYICIANKLEEVYDKMVQPQKRLLVRKLLDACLGRVIELKYDLVNTDIMEFNYNEAVIDRLRLTSMDTELRIPRYFLRERQTEIELRKQRMNEILIRLGWMEEHPMKEKLTEIEAICLIQIHERARQGRLRAHFMKELRMLKEKIRSPLAKGRGRGIPAELAAIKIQKLWRGYECRKKTRLRTVEEMVLIGMMPPSKEMQKESSEKKEKLNEIFTRRYQTQTIYTERLVAQLQKAQDEIKTEHGPAMMEHMADEIRGWIKDCYDSTGKLPELPTVDQGGSLHLFSRPESERSLSSARSSKDSRKAKDTKKSAARIGDLNLDNNHQTCENLQPKQSVFLPVIKAEIEQFNNIWRNRKEITDHCEAVYEDMVYEDQFQKVQQELRKTVDELLRQELEFLQTALGKKAKKSNKKVRRSGKKSKRKKEKDLTPDHTPEQLYEELIANGLIRKYPETRLEQYLGEKALIARNGMNPSSGDIRQILIEYCIIPLGSEAVRNSCPLIRSIMLAGPKGSGKKMLLHAICTEVGAVLFDLTPANIVGKYPGKTGLIMLVHLVLKVSRLMQPAVIYMGDAERPFMKKVSKSDRTDPKRLKKDLSKLVRTIAAEDRVIFIGTSSSPWEADQKLLQQTYNRFIYIPRPDFGSLSLAWKTYLNEYSGEMAALNNSMMAKISDGYTIGVVHNCVKEVLTCKRKTQLVSQPLTYAELINSLSTHDPVYREEEEAFEVWWSKTPLGRRRQRLIELEEEFKIEELGKQSNGKKT